MLDQNTEERVSLFVLGLMDPATRRDFEAEQSRNPALRLAVKQMHQSMEVLALAVPPAKPPADLFPKIARRIRRDSFFGRIPGPTWIKIALPMAACLVLGFLLNQLRPTSPLASTQASSQPARPALRVPAASRGMQGDVVQEVEAQSLKTIISKQKEALAELTEAYALEIQKNRDLADHLRLTRQNQAKLENQLQGILQPLPGVKPMMVISLGTPRVKATNLFAENASKILIEDAVKQIIPPPGNTSNLNQLVSTPPFTNSSPVQPGSNTPTPAGYLQAGANAGYLPGKDNALATLTESSRPASDTGPANPTSMTGRIDEPGKVTSSNPTAASGTLAMNTLPTIDIFTAKPDSGTRTVETSLPKTTPGDLTAPPATGVAIFDQSSQSGSLVVNGVQPPGANQTWQLWTFNTENSQPVSVGVVPRLTNGFGQIDFTMPATNLVPNRFMITLEPTGGSQMPSGQVLLDGANP